jgi:hypothetical protein
MTSEWIFSAIFQMDTKSWKSSRVFNYNTRGFLKNKDWLLVGFSRRILAYLGTISSLAIISLTMIRIPQTFIAYYDYIHSRKLLKKREDIWFSKSPQINSYITLLQLPAEIQFIILSYLDTTSICRVIQTCKYMAKWNAYNLFWMEKLIQEWPDYSAKSYNERTQRAIQVSHRFYRNYKTLYKNLPQVSINFGQKKVGIVSVDCPPALLFYKQRFISFRKYLSTKKQKHSQRTLQNILSEQRDIAIGKFILSIFKSTEK